MTSKNQFSTPKNPNQSEQSPYLTLYAKNWPNEQLLFFGQNFMFQLRIFLETRLVKNRFQLSQGSSKYFLIVYAMNKGKWENVWKDPATAGTDSSLANFVLCYTLLTRSFRNQAIWTSSIGQKRKSQKPLFPYILPYRP